MQWSAAGAVEVGAAAESTDDSMTFEATMIPRDYVYLRNIAISDTMLSDHGVECLAQAVDYVCRE